MTSSLQHDPTQALILRTYTTLYQLRQDWGGSFILSLGLDLGGVALSMAATIAGAVSLAIDNEPAHLREVARTGAVDFTVTTLDEAIRAMKNEVRKHTPLSVALNADPIAAMAEVVERGLAPQLFAIFLPPHPSIVEAATAFYSLGATLMDFTAAPHALAGFQSSQSILRSLREDNDWILQTFTCDTPAALRAFDAKALDFLPPEDTIRRRWLQSAPRILHRQRPPHRTLWLTEAEKRALDQSSTLECSGNNWDVSS